MPFEPLLRFVVEFVQVLREQVAEREPVQRVVDIPVAQVVDIPVEVQIDIPVEVQVAVRVRIERVPLWVAPLSLRRALH